ncbi:Lamina-associated polypeptide 2, isoforms beta/delta/epsilon/gamma [Channa argus]|uniref:Lamina-associated polypeptide 2, isoforms beta/delta/epsilon/gamma n=1 Tax=Channa argus TaxID=215402 RepID=A0A6G1Q426_CHAAH|nr:Lamina-associated polypeptide 2, isoforms beta/delta/epsilon/gamma [Channa argus]
MPHFVEDPLYLSKSRLKSDLVAHDVALPPARSNKEVYVKLHKKHIDQKTDADFSSDEEDRVQDVAEEDPELPDPRNLTDDGLKAALLKHGVKAGPIVASTRALYERKLSQLLQSDGHDRPNGAEKAVLYSDSEGEEEDGQEDDADSDSEAKEETMEEQPQQASSQVDLNFQNGDLHYPQCFLPSSRLVVCASRNREPDGNSGNALKSSERSQPRCSQIPVGISKASSVGQCSRLASGVPSGSQSVKANDCSSFSSQTFSITQMVEEMESRRSPSITTNAERDLNGGNVKERCSWSDWPDIHVVDTYTLKNQSLYYTPKASPHKLRKKELVKDTLKDLFPDTQTTSTGIYATRRRPIKGAAGRPVQYVYPDSPASPSTLERREVERRLVPIHIQILVFIILTCLLYLIYVCVEDNSLSPFVALLQSLSQGSEDEHGLLLQDKTQDTPALSAQQ